MQPKVANFARQAASIGRRSLNTKDALALALACHQGGRLAEAELGYAEILVREPEHADALHLLGLVKLQQGATQDAYDLISQAICAKPEYAQAHQNLAEALRLLDRLQEAESALRRALELQPGYAKAHYNLGRVLRRLGRLDEARAALLTAIELQAGDAQSLQELGEILLLLGMHKEAEVSLRRAVAVQPGNAAMHFTLGVTLQELGLMNEAAGCYVRALAINPQHDAAKNNLAHALPYLVDPQHSLARAREALATDPRQAESHRNLGIALWQCGDNEAARSALEESVRLEPQCVVGYCYLGLVAKARGQLDEALTWVKRALAIDPEDVYALAAEASIEAEKFGPKPGHRVALHLAQGYHYRILRPVFDAVSGKHSALLTPHIKELVDFNPDVVVVAESQAGMLRDKLPRALFVWVRHGLISKNATCFAARTADFACLTSEASKAWYMAQGGRPRKDYWITGYPQLDPLFRATPMPITLKLPQERKTVLYAPTWTAGLSSAPMLGERVVNLICGERCDLSIVIKPHPVTAAHTPDWLVTWRALAEAHAHVHLIDDIVADVMPYLMAADVLISDVSSVIFEYLALDRPIILLTNPDHRGTSHFDPKGIEWLWRDVGTEVHDVEDLPAAVSAALDNPRLGSDRRAHYRRELFGDYADGRAAERIAQKITELKL
jgi:tetratricopeptide (TPR) repeat protein